MAARFSAVIDSCALVPISLADTLLRLADADLYRPLWSTQILSEVARTLEELHPDMKESGAARRGVSVMNEAFNEACIDGWETLLDAIDLPDKDDRHVVAAAVQGRADLIVTANLKHFPAEVLDNFHLEAQHPDDFLVNQLDLDAERVMMALNAQAEAARRPPLNVEDVLESLARCEVPQFVLEARRQIWRLTRQVTGG